MHWGSVETQAMRCCELRCAEVCDEARSDQVVEVRKADQAHKMGQVHDVVCCCVMVVIDVVGVVLAVRSLSVLYVEVDRPL